MQAASTGVLTFLFTDVEGSTRAWERSPDAMRAALERHDAIIQEETARHSGSIFKHIGDGFCCAFSLPADALMAAIEIQRRLQSEEWPSGIEPLRVRIGIHSGTAIPQDGDYFGPTLNRVARLMDVGYGGQILVSSAVASLVRGELNGRAELLPLGDHRLKDLNEPESIFQVIADGLKVDFPELQTLDVRPNNLPSQISSFVGRESELRDLRALLNEHRLVTIAGSGGIGKTRLLLQLAAESVDSFKDGVWIAHLASVSDPELVVPTISAALGVLEIPGEPSDQTLLRYLSSRELLLGLDNCEQILTAVAALTKTLLERAPSVKILATSRQPLHVRGEQVYRVEPMADAESTGLFTERAREASHDFSVLPAQTAEIEAICRTLQGIPLAIELAAARTATLSLEEIRGRLDRQLTFLSAPSASEDDRHRTLKATIAWSYDLLSPGEKEMLAAISAFAESFTLQACEAVAASERDEVLDLLTSLCDKSFVSVRKNGVSRYRVLDSIRTFAISAADPALIASLQAKHAGFYLALAAKANDPLPHDLLAEWLNAVEADIANIRLALTYGFDHRTPELGTALCGMWRYWYVRRKIAEGRAWFSRYIETADPADELIPPMLRRLSAFASLQRDYDRAAQFARSSLEMYQDRHDTEGVLAATSALAVNEYRRGNAGQADELYKQISAAVRTRNHPSALAMALRNRATLKLFDQKLSEAAELLAEGRQLAQTLGDAEQLSGIEGLEGSLAYERGDLESADTHFQRALEMRQQLGNDYGVAEVVLAIASVRIRQKNLEEAMRCIGSSLYISLEVDSADLAANAIETYAEAKIAECDWDTALQLFVDSALIRKLYCYAYNVKLGHRQIAEQLRSRYGKEVDERIERIEPPDWKASVRTWLATLPEAKPQSRHDVFICHSSEDKVTADAACAKLEAAGIRCWMAPRDPIPGTPYGGQIINAISQAHVVLLVFSANANRSEHVRRELELAAESKKTIVPLRVEETLPSGDLKYYITGVQWLDATKPPMEARLNELAVLVQGMLNASAAPAASTR